MQTFLPLPSFRDSARCLDRQRLGKQRIEALQIARSLMGVGQGWRNHPALRMWSGHHAALLRYGVAVCDEWTRRGYRDGCRAQMEDLMDWSDPVVPPPWLGSAAFHASHRAALLHKLPDWYGQFGWSEKPCINYVWPLADTTRTPR